MTQPAKVQEPSMEEILASIRRIIADDEAKPAAGSKPEAAKAESAKPELAKPQPFKPEPSRSDVSAGAAMKSDSGKVEMPKQQVAAVSPSSAPSPIRQAPVAAKPAAVESNSQDDIDAMLAGFDETPAPPDLRPLLPEADVFELTDEMALPDPAPNPFLKVDPQNDLEFSESASRFRQPSYEPTPETPPQAAQNILSRTTVSAVESAFNSLANTVLSNNARTLEDLVKEMLRPMLKTWLDDNLPGVVERIVKTEIERVSRGR